MAKTDVELAAPARRDPWVTRDKVVHLLQTKGLLIAFALFLVAFSLASDRFASVDNVSTVLRQVAIVGTIAVGVTIVRDRRQPRSLGRLAALVLDGARRRPARQDRPGAGDRDHVRRRARGGLRQRASGRLRAAQLADRDVGHAVGHPGPDADLFRRAETSTSPRTREGTWFAFLRARLSCSASPCRRGSSSFWPCSSTSS